jgi:hypothetical protein
MIHFQQPEKPWGVVVALGLWAACAFGAVSLFAW